MALVVPERVPHGGGQDHMGHIDFATRRLEHVEVAENRAAHAIVGDAVQVDDAREVELLRLDMAQEVRQILQHLVVRAVRVVKTGRVNQDHRLASKGLEAIDADVGRACCTLAAWLERAGDMIDAHKLRVGIQS